MLNAKGAIPERSETEASGYTISYLLYTVDGIFSN